MNLAQQMQQRRILMRHRHHQSAINSAAAFKPSDISGLQLWLKADQIISLSDGDPVATWSDQSGNSNNATQATTSKKPLYKTAIQNSKPIVRFDGVDDFLQLTANLTTTGGFTFFIVQQSDAGQDDSWLGSNAGNRQFKLQTGGSVLIFNGVSSFSSSAFSVSRTSFIIGEVTNDTNTFSFFENGNAKGTSGSSATIDDTLNQIGVFLNTGSPLKGDIGEILVYNSALSSANRLLVETYLNSRWSLY